MKLVIFYSCLYTGCPAKRSTPLIENLLGNSIKGWWGGGDTFFRTPCILAIMAVKLLSQTWHSSVW